MPKKKYETSDKTRFVFVCEQIFKHMQIILVSMFTFEINLNIDCID